ncbi:hypothetical protein V6N13_146429 [Hibiscus sabdariffa]|uniref:Peptidylprolyl isomerase n=1 Tax=Hibiscus sabdariffa TaxID=183260 RepID=A0ABR2TTB6_9ROSI
MISSFCLIVLHILLPIFLSCCHYIIVLVAIFMVLKAEASLGILNEITLNMHHSTPPYALIQGTVEAQGTVFKDIPPEACPTIRRGSIAWVGSGPEFFISLANHNEWRKAYTVFGYVP